MPRYQWTTVTLSRPDPDDPTSPETGDLYPLSIELDSEANAGKTVFYTGDDVFFKVRRGSGTSYTKEATMGIVSGDSVDNAETVAGTLLFQNQAEARLPFKRYANLSFSWTGADPGTPTITEDLVAFSEPKTAVMNYSLTAYFDRIKLNCSTPGEVLVSVSAGSQFASAGATISDEEQPPTTADQTLQYKDYFTGAALGGVSVYVDGTLAGTTDSNGYITLPGLTIGQEYTLRATLSGYADSDADPLNNDSFVAGGP